MSLTLQRRGLVDEYNGYQFRRESMAHDSAGKLIYPHNARFESGPFGDKAILVEEGTTNIGSPASLFDSSWVLENGTSTVIDAYTRKYTFTSTPRGAFAFNRNFTLTTGVAYTWSAEIKGEGSTVGKQVRLQSAAESAFGTPVTLTSEWQRVTLTFTATATSRAVGFIGIPVNAFAAGDIVYIRNFQWEQKPYATTFTPSVRADESLIVNTDGLLSSKEGSIEFWFDLNDMFLDTSIYSRYLLSISSYPDTLYLSRYGSNRVRLYVRNSEGSSEIMTTVSDKAWTLISLTWTTNEISLYINNTIRNSAEFPKFPQILNRLRVGSLGQGEYANTSFAHLRLSSIARTQEQLAPLDGPPEVDEYTTLYLPFNGPDNVRAAKVVTL